MDKPDCEISTLSRIKDLSKVPTGGTPLPSYNPPQTEFKKNTNGRYLVTNFALKSVKAAGKTQPQILSKCLQENAMTLDDYCPYSFLEFGRLKYLVDDLIIESQQVVGRLINPDMLRMRDPMCLPYFDLQKLPFVIVRDNESGNFYIVNLRTKSVTLFLRADSRT